MELKYINPFIESVYDLFASMLSAKVERENPTLVQSMETHREIVAMIGLSGPVRGNVAMLFPQETALAIVSRFIGEPVASVDDSVIDAVAELVNIVAGGAKSRLSDGETPIKLSLPNVIRGKGCTVHYPTTSVWLDVPFESELGAFNLRLSFKIDNEDKEG
jgi:chemotaxis protein CheX